MMCDPRDLSDSYFELQYWLDQVLRMGGSYEEIKKIVDDAVGRQILHDIINDFDRA